MAGKMVGTRCQKKGCEKRFGGTKAVYDEMVAKFTANKTVTCPTCKGKVKDGNFCTDCGNKLK